LDIFTSAPAGSSRARRSPGRRPRDDERLAVAGVEPLRDVARELEMLALVVADRDDVGLVQQDVAAISTG
jgi:hypothetical protein